MHFLFSKITNLTLKEEFKPKHLILEVLDVNFFDIFYEMYIVSARMYLHRTCSCFNLMNVILITELSSSIPKKYG